MIGSISRWAAPTTALLAFAIGLPASAANRVWVSGHGVDQAGCGAPTAPCRSLQYSLDHIVAAGGEIDILDPAGYGAITITKAVSIVNDGVGTAGVQATSGAAITVNAGVSDAVYLRGLSVDGVLRAGSNGLDLQAAGSLTVDHCVFRHFLQNGVELLPTSTDKVKLLIKDTDLSDNSTGLTVQPGDAAGVAGAVDHVVANANANDGFSLDGSFTTGSIKIAITNSLATNSVSAGVHVESNNANMVVTMDSDTATANGTGLDVRTHGVVHLARSVLNQNLDGIFMSGGGTVFTSGDNQINGDPSPLIGTLTPEALQ